VRACLPPRAKRTPEELRAAGDLVAEEFSALRLALQGIAQMRASPPTLQSVTLSVFGGRALYYGAALHMRSFTHFAYPEGNHIKPDDILAEDFVANWIAVRPAPSPTLVDFRRRVGKEVAHLTYSRTETATWSLIPEVLGILLAVMQKFVAHLPFVPWSHTSEPSNPRTRPTATYALRIVEASFRQVCPEESYLDQIRPTPPSPAALAPTDVPRPRGRSLTEPACVDRCMFALRDSRFANIEGGWL
jgi:hypothetical protein